MQMLHRSYPLIPVLLSIALSGCGGGGGESGGGGNPPDPPISAPDPPLTIQAAFGDGSVTVSWQSQAGSSHEGYAVTTNVYVSTSPNIDVRNFHESPTDQVQRGLTIMLPVVFRGFENGTPVYIVATDEANGVESAPSAEISVTPQPVPPLVEDMIALNDSGVFGCTNPRLRNLPCPIPKYPSQDADIGRDAAARTGQLVKTGFGPAGFDFTKLDKNGDPLPDDASRWPCIRDNVTGLIWQVLGDSGLTSVDNLYTWYEPDPLRSGGFAGQPDGGSCARSRCDTHAFIRALNEAGHCGFRDWRLPTRRELVSLADLSRSGPGVVVEAFPRLPQGGIWFFWSSGTNSSTSGVGGLAWALDLSTGGIVSRPKWPSSPSDIPGHILAVRADATE